MQIIVFLMTLMAAMTVALPVVISPIPMAVRDIAVAELVTREPIKSGNSNGSGFKREAIKSGNSNGAGFKREAVKSGNSNGAGFKREAAKSGNSNGSGF